MSRRPSQRGLTGPSVARPSSRRTYTAVSAAESTPIAAQKGNSATAPTKMWNSATKPLSPGKPSEASPAMPKKITNSGMRLMIPPNCVMSRVWAWS